VVELRTNSWSVVGWTRLSNCAGQSSRRASSSSPLRKGVVRDQHLAKVVVGLAGAELVTLAAWPSHGFPGLVETARECRAM
jgi:hypothetical protein